MHETHYTMIARRGNIPYTVGATLTRAAFSMV